LGALVIVLGIDPGVTTGLCILTCDGEDWHLERRWEYRWETVYDLYLHLQETVEALSDPVLAMELMLSYGANTADEKVEAQTIVKLLAQQRGHFLATYAPATVRSSVCGTGRSTPAQIKATMRHFLDLPKVSKRGEAFTVHQQDAAAVALCYLVCSGSLRVLRPQGRSVAA
jgi:Holliday junction resolvasome RuvABC endonuclease subunit